MKNDNKILQLKSTIYKTLMPLIVGDFVFIDLPYYKNIGDVLIWEGTEEFLKSVSYKCLHKSSFFTFDKAKIRNERTIIIMQGGGNWGDIWIEHQNFRKEIIRNYPNNRIIILPQTVFYLNQKILLEDLKLFNSHKDLYICARDNSSFELLKKHIDNRKLMLLPDMAFCINVSKIRKQKQISSLENLFLQRQDKELNTDSICDFIPPGTDIKDWPTYEYNSNIERFYYYMSKFLSSFDCIFKLKSSFVFSDFYYNSVIRPYYIRKGVKFISLYKYIYTTRLHGAILSILLDKEITFIDNSYGKNSGYYSTWLNDLDTVKMIK